MITPRPCHVSFLGGEWWRVAWTSWTSWWFLWDFRKKKWDPKSSTSITGWWWMVAISFIFPWILGISSSLNWRSLHHFFRTGWRAQTTKQIHFYQLFPMDINHLANGNFPPSGGAAIFGSGLPGRRKAPWIHINSREACRKPPEIFRPRICQLWFNACNSLKSRVYLDVCHRFMLANVPMLPKKMIN